MPNNEGVGFVDYVLWGADGKPLGLVEAKRSRADARRGQQQAKLYADALEARFGQRPVIFYSNGYEHWIWDDLSYPPRQIGGFYTRDELALLIQRRTDPREARGDADQPRDRRQQAPVSAARHPRHHQELRGGWRAQGASRDGDGLGQDAHRDRARRPLDARELGEARALPRRSRGAREPGDRRLQGASAGRRAREPRHRPLGPRPRLPLDLPDDDEPHRRQAGRQGEVRPRPFRPHRDRRGASLDLPALSRDLRIFRQLPRRAHRDAEGRDRQEHLFALRPRGRRADRRLFARRGGGRGAPRAAQGDLGAAQVQPPGHSLRRSERGRKRPMGHARMGRGGDPRQRRRGGVEQMAVQHGHGRSRDRASDGERPQGRGRRPARQDDHLRQEPGACAIHRGALQRRLPRSRRAFRPRDHL